MTVANVHIPTVLQLDKFPCFSLLQYPLPCHSLIVTQWSWYLETACNMSSSSGAAKAGSRWMNVARQTIHKLTVSSSYDSSTMWHVGQRSTTRFSQVPAERWLVGCCRFAAADWDALFNKSARLVRRLMTTQQRVIQNAFTLSRPVWGSGPL